MKFTIFFIMLFLSNQFLFSQTNEIDSTEVVEKVILSLSDSGMKNSEPINVKSPWRLVYYNGADESVFAVYLHRLDGEFESILVSTAKGGAGKTYCYKSGKFYLSIMGFGDWTIKVVQEE